MRRALIDRRWWLQPKLTPLGECVAVMALALAVGLLSAAWCSL